VHTAQKKCEPAKNRSSGNTPRHATRDARQSRIAGPRARRPLTAGDALLQHPANRHSIEEHAMPHTVESKPAKAALRTPSDLPEDATAKVAAALNPLLADTFALYIKTKNFHWHMSGPHFRDYHLLLDEQGEQIFDMTDDIAERVRKIGQTTLRSIGQIAKLQRIRDNDKPFVPPEEMLAELRNDNLALAVSMREAHDVCDEAGDVASASELENWIDETERRAWFLFEATRHV
jgi:starvation-inducible DNA-binding protein